MTGFEALLRCVQSALALALLCLASPLAHAYVDETQKNAILFSEYKPIYFLLGKPYSKIELSFKARVMREAPIYFGYTQLMMWHLFISSPNFRDLNYSPEAFYRFTLPGDDRWLDLSPLQHESNGKGYGQEVSWNRAYARYQWVDHFSDGSRLIWNATVWAPFWEKRNPNLPKYRGLGELVTTLTDLLGGTWNKSDLTLRFYLGGGSYVNPLQGGQELTLRLRSHPTSPPIELQLFHGYGENLLDFQERRLAFRFGIGL